MISSLANVSPKAKIGKNVTIEAFATVYHDVEIVTIVTYILMPLFILTPLLEQVVKFFLVPLLASLARI